MVGDHALKGRHLGRLLYGVGFFVFKKDNVFKADIYQVKPKRLQENQRLKADRVEALIKKYLDNMEGFYDNFW